MNIAYIGGLWIGLIIGTFVWTRFIQWILKRIHPSPRQNIIIARNAVFFLYLGFFLMEYTTEKAILCLIPLIGGLYLWTLKDLQKVKI